MVKKIRLDQLLIDKYPAYSRRQIQSWIMQGKVTSADGTILNKPGAQLHADAPVHIDIQEEKYVSRAGYKLEKALEAFSVDVNGKTVLDAGLSTGGFADCLLQHGAAQIIGIDVGYGQVHHKIATDSRVRVIERTNLRYITQETIGTFVDMVTLDLSFISILKVMPAINNVLKPFGQLITLIKPQFEATKGQVGRGGIIKDDALHQEIVKKVTQGIAEYGYECLGVTESPVLGSQGNKEFLALFVKK